MLLGGKYPLLESNAERESGECGSHAFALVFKVFVIYPLWTPP
jgi:hypothetical protein